MKIAFGAVDRFVQNPDPAARVILVYGPDSGLVRERAQQMARHVCPQLDDPFRVASLTGAMVADDPARLADEMAAQSLSGGKRLVYLQAGDGIALALGHLLSALPTTDTVLVIEASELDKRSKLRALCEDAPQAAAIACYPEEGEAKIRVIAGLLRAANMTADTDALQLLAEATPADRLALKSEVEKIISYALDRKKVSVSDVQACMGDGSAADLDALIMAVGLGDTATTGAMSARLFAEAVPFVLILRSLQRHLLRLQLARAAMDGGQSAEAAIKALKPPVFWKHEGAMVRQAQRWSGERLARALEVLASTEAQCKTTGMPAETLCAQTLLSMAR
jgi:DNA polymerase III subunit delta